MRRTRSIAVAMGADAVGFVFAPSPRQMSAKAVAAITRRLPREICTVGVFRDEEPSRVVEIVNRAGLDAAQLHGTESFEDCGYVAVRVPLVIKAFSAGDDRLARAAEYGADIVLLDAPSPGSGKVFDWRLAEGAPHGRRVVLAGGLDPGNVAEAIRTVHPWGVDVASGVEATVGQEGPDEGSRLRAGRPRRRAGTLRQRRHRPLRLAGGRLITLGELMREPQPGGRFGEFGGRFVPESLVPGLRGARERLRQRVERSGVPRPPRLPPAPLRRPPDAGHRVRSPLASGSGCGLLLKREDLAHTGSHKINNVIGQALLAERMGKRRLIAETGAGQHGVATATAAALFGLECLVYMGEVDVERQELNVFRMELLGAEVRAVQSGSRTLKDAINEALRDWVATVETTHYCIGSVMGPASVPVHSARVAAVVGDEARAQCHELPRRLRPRRRRRLRRGRFERRRHLRRLRRHRARGSSASRRPAAAAMSNGVLGAVHGMRSRFLQDEVGQILEASSISAGLDYPGVGPEHAYLGAIGRAEYVLAEDEEVLAAFRLLSEYRGHHPRSRAGARARLGREGGRQVDPAGIRGADHALGPRRQGRGAGPGPHAVTSGAARESAAGSSRRRRQAARSRT